MDTDIKLNGILSQVQKLNKDEQVSVLRKINSMISNVEKSVKSARLSDISGVGSYLWKDVDIDKYIDSERQW